MILLAGTDNVFLPSQKLALSDGTPFAQGKSHLYYFSKVCVLILMLEFRSSYSFSGFKGDSSS